MNMYATLTFTSVVAWVALVTTSFILLVILVDELWPRSRLERLLKKQRMAEMGFSDRVDPRRIVIITMIWLICGWYLMG